MQFNELLEFIDSEHKRLVECFYKDSSKKEFVLSNTIKIGEEFGELCDEILHSFSNQRREKMENTNNIEDEFADVIITTLLLAKSMNIDINKALEIKIDKIKNRVY